MALEHFDIGGSRVDRGLRALHGGDRLVAIGLGLFLQLPARPVVRDQRVLPIELELHSPRGGLGRGKLRPSLLDGRFLGGDLVRHARDGRFLCCDFLARGIDRQPIVAVVDGGDHFARMHVGIVGDRHVRDIAGDLGGKRRVVGLHISVVGGDQETADRQIAVAEPSAGAGSGEHDRGEHKLAAPGAPRGRWRGRRAGCAEVGAVGSRGAAAGGGEAGISASARWSSVSSA